MPITDRLEQKLDRLDERMDSMSKTLVEQAGDLREHIRRTELLEAAHAELRAEIRPLTRAHFMWSGVGKALAILATAAGVAEGVIRLVHK